MTIRTPYKEESRDNGLGACSDEAMNVRITVALQGRVVAIDQVTDRRISDPFVQAGKQIAIKLERLRCPVHGKTASNVRLHFDVSGAVDLQYDSCCERLGTVIGRALG